MSIHNWKIPLRIMSECASINVICIKQNIHFLISITRAWPRRLTDHAFVGFL